MHIPTRTPRPPNMDGIPRMKPSEKYHRGMHQLAQIIADKLYKQEKINPLEIIALELYTMNLRTDYKE